MAVGIQPLELCALWKNVHASSNFSSVKEENLLKTCLSCSSHVLHWTPTTIFPLFAQDMKAPSGLSGRLHHFIFIVLHISLRQRESLEPMNILMLLLGPLGQPSAHNKHLTATPLKTYISHDQEGRGEKKNSLQCCKVENYTNIHLRDCLTFTFSTHTHNQQ